MKRYTPHSWKLAMQMERFGITVLMLLAIYTNGVFSNSSNSQRENSLTSIVQNNSLDCSISVTPSILVFSALGGTGTVTVTSNGNDPSNCNWLIRSSVPWITITQPANGQGNGIVKFIISPTIASRTGTLVIGNRVVVISQEANPCSLVGIGIKQEQLVPGLITERVIASDFNGDKLVDFVAWGADSNAFMVGFGNGAGGFGNLKIYFANDPVSFAAVDFDQDGAMDLAFYERLSQRIVIMMNKGEGSLTKFYQIPAAIFPVVQRRNEGFYVGDFNNDGKPDLIINAAPVSQPYSISATILAGNGDGTFTKTLSKLPAGANGKHFEIGDYNGDGNAGLASWEIPSIFQSSKSITIWTGNGAGEFTEASQVILDAPLLLLYASDLNTDGFTDLVTYTYDSDTIIVLAKPGGGFAKASTYRGIGSYGAIIGDFNGDNKLDILFRRNFVTLWINNGLGVFNELPNFAISGVPALGDVNGDGANDIIAFDRSGLGNTMITTIPNFTRCFDYDSAKIVSATNHGGVRVASDSLATLFGNALSNQANVAGNLFSPTSFFGARIVVKDRFGTEFVAPLLYNSYNQVGFLVPSGLELGTAIVSAERLDGSVVRNTVEITNVSPGLFSDEESNSGIAIATVLRVKANGERVYESTSRYDPTTGQTILLPIDLSNQSEQVYLLLFGTGFRHHSGLSNVRVKLGEEEAEVLFAGAQSDFVGLDQCNVRLPNSLAGRGEINIALTVDGKTSNTVKTRIK